MDRYDPYTDSFIVEDSNSVGVSHLTIDQFHVRTVQLVELTDECIEKIVSKIADVKPVVRGEWVFNSYDEDAYDVHGNKSWANRYYCSNCNFEHAFIENHTGQYNFCPNCGADMRGKKDE